MDCLSILQEIQQIFPLWNKVTLGRFPLLNRGWHLSAQSICSRRWPLQAPSKFSILLGVLRLQRTYSQIHLYATMRGAECGQFPCAIRNISSTHVITWYDTKKDSTRTRRVSWRGKTGWVQACSNAMCVPGLCFLQETMCFLQIVFKSDMECLMSSCRGRFYLPNCVSNYDNFLTGAGNTRSTCAQADALCEQFLPWNLAIHVLVPPTKVADGPLIGNRSKSLLHYVCLAPKLYGIVSM